MKPIDVLIVGAGPAGLATAIRLKQQFTKDRRDATVVVIDKAAKLGYHSLSGSILDTTCLDELLPGWQTTAGNFLAELAPVRRNEMFFLTGRAAFQIPPLLVPGGMKHHGEQLVSLSRLVDWLGQVAGQAGVEIYSGFAASSLLWEGTAVRGVRLVDCGLDHSRKPQKNFLAGEEIPAAITVLADGGRGVLSQEYTSVIGGKNKNPQVYSIGVKQIFKLPKKNTFGPNRAISTLGFPNRPDVFGGGFLYSLGNDHLAAGLILGLDWRYTDLNPEQEFELFKTHPFIQNFLQDAQLVAAGAKTIPEGGYFSLPQLGATGALLVGDAAGFVNMEKIQGIQYAIRSGMAAADAISTVLRQDSPSEKILTLYEAGLKDRGVLSDLYRARNFRQVFQWGIFAGAPLSQIQSFLPGALALTPDHTHTQAGARLKRTFRPTVDRTTLAALAGTHHREDEPAHLIIPDETLCRRCAQEFACPCTTFCPTEVYRRQSEKITISASNCIHCGTCAIKCPLANIRWTPPEGGEGPRYKMM